MAETRKKVLCIEDDRETAALIAEELVERGFEVSVAHDGRAGFAGQRGELWHARGHVPAASAADAELVPAADERADAVPLRLEGVAVVGAEAA